MSLLRCFEPGVDILDLGVPGRERSSAASEAFPLLHLVLTGETVGAEDALLFVAPVAEAEAGAAVLHERGQRRRCDDVGVEIAGDADGPTVELAAIAERGGGARQADGVLADEGRPVGPDAAQRDGADCAWQ